MVSAIKVILSGIGILILVLAAATFFFGDKSRLTEEQKAMISRCSQNPDIRGCESFVRTKPLPNELAREMAKDAQNAGQEVLEGENESLNLNISSESNLTESYTNSTPALEDSEAADDAALNPANSSNQ
ncbi:hypothetical protein J4212_03260 [Candidatus Woesearchaeota archaeon]|nr:hypothetical protein [Candidatus Woesearchaeota archaeon]